MRKYVQIGPSRYKLKMLSWRSAKLDGSRGYHAESNEIGLADDLPKDMEAEVLMHEILHAIYFTFNMNKVDGLHDLKEDVEESIVSMYSTALCTVFAQNPWLLDYLRRHLTPR